MVLAGVGYECSYKHVHASQLIKLLDNTYLLFQGPTMQNLAITTMEN